MDLIIIENKKVMQGSKITSDRVLLHSTLRPLYQILSQMIDYCMCDSSVTLVQILYSQPRKKWNHEPILGCLSQFDECAQSRGWHELSNNFTFSAVHTLWGRLEWGMGLTKLSYYIYGITYLIDGINGGINNPRTN